MTALSRCLPALVVCICPMSAAAPQGAAGILAVGLRPPAPRQGSLVLLAVRPSGMDSVFRVDGELAGEPLHFELVGSEFRALGAGPPEARDSGVARGGGGGAAPAPGDRS